MDDVVWYVYMCHAYICIDAAAAQDAGLSLSRRVYKHIYIHVCIHVWKHTNTHTNKYT